MGHRIGADTIRRILAIGLSPREAELQIAEQLAELRKDTEAIRYVDLGPTVPRLRVGYHKEHGKPHVYLVTLKGPQGNLEVANQAQISIDDALLYIRGILDAVAKALKSRTIPLGAVSLWARKYDSAATYVSIATPG